MTTDPITELLRRSSLRDAPEAPDVGAVVRRAGLCCAADDLETALYRLGPLARLRARPTLDHAAAELTRRDDTRGVRDLAHAVDRAATTVEDLEADLGRHRDGVRRSPAAFTPRITVRFSRACEQAATLRRTLARDVDLVRAIGLDHAGDLGLGSPAALVGGLGLGRAIARNRDRAGALYDLLVETERAVAILGVAEVPWYARLVELHHDLVRTCQRAHDAGRELGLAHELANRLAGTRPAPPPTPSARLGQDDADAALDRLTAEPATLAADLALLRPVIRILDTARDDFLDADLADADPSGVWLHGVQWAPGSTRWPPDRQDEIRRASVEIAPGVFEIQRASLRSVELV